MENLGGFGKHKADIRGIVSHEWNTLIRSQAKFTS